MKIRLAMLIGLSCYTMYVNAMSYSFNLKWLNPIFMNQEQEECDKITEKGQKALCSNLVLYQATTAYQMAFEMLTDLLKKENLTDAKILVQDMKNSWNANGNGASDIFWQLSQFLEEALELQHKNPDQYNTELMSYIEEADKTVVTAKDVLKNLSEQFEMALLVNHA